MFTGQKIKNYLEKNNILQNKLSVATRIAPAKLNLILSGKRNLKVDEYEVICGCLEVSVDTFIEPRKPESTQKGA